MLKAMGVVPKGLKVTRVKRVQVRRPRRARKTTKGSERKDLREPITLLANSFWVVLAIRFALKPLGFFRLISFANNML